MSYDFQPVNPQQMRQVYLQTPHNPFSTQTKFDGVLDKINMGINMFGPALTTGLSQAGLGKGAQITSAALMGVPMSGGGMSAPGYGGAPTSGKYLSWGNQPGTAKNIGGLPVPDAPGYPGAGGVGGFPGGAPGFPGGGGGLPGGPGGLTDVSAFDSQINSMMNNNLLFLSLQTKVQQTAQTTQMMSNIAKTDWDSKMAAIRNMRA